MAADERPTDEFVTRREFDQLREADQRALSIKEAANQAALELAREHQRYRDEQANNLREQINNERGEYVTRAELEAAVAKIEAELKPVLSFMSSQQGRASGISAQMSLFITLAALAVSVMAIVLSR
jgi:vacuolar-type H+-ATPase subunit H